MRALATELGVGVGTVGGWLTEYRPRPEVARRLADYFGVSVEDLLDDQRELPGTAEPSYVAQEASDIPPGTKWGKLSPEQRGQLAMAAALDSEAVQDLIRRAAPFWPQVVAMVEALEAAAKVDPAARPKPQVKTAGQKKKGQPKAPKFLPVTLPSQTQALSAETGKPLPAPLRRVRPA